MRKRGRGWTDDDHCHPFRDPCRHRDRYRVNALAPNRAVYLALLLIACAGQGDCDQTCERVEKASDCLYDLLHRLALLAKGNNNPM